MRYVKWILVALGGIIAYKVYLRIRAAHAARNPKAAAEGTTSPDNRQPGVVSSMLDAIGGVFNFGPNPSVPTIASGYGAVGVQASPGGDTYVAVPNDNRVPTFLAGATGGAIDTAQTGSAPPPVLGPPPAAGSGAYFAPRSNVVTKNYAAAGARKAGLTNTNPTIPAKPGAIADSGGFTSKRVLVN